MPFKIKSEECLHRLVTIVIKNIGDVTAHNVMCFAVAVDRDGNFVDIGDINYFEKERMSIREIKPGKTKKLTIFFDNLGWDIKYRNIEYRFYCE